MAVATKVMNEPIHANFLPAVAITDPMTPFLLLMPTAYSPIINGILQRKRNSAQTKIKAPPPSSLPFWATILGKRQILPVPMAIPRALNKNPYRVEKR